MGEREEGVTCAVCGRAILPDQAVAAREGRIVHAECAPTGAGPERGW
jgi:hypothetical protein